MLQIPQVVQPGVVETRPLLPSFLYLPGPKEQPAGSLALPWDAERDYAAGEFARNFGSQVPTAPRQFREILAVSQRPRSPATVLAVEVGRGGAGFRRCRPARTTSNIWPKRGIICWPRTYPLIGWSSRTSF